MKTMCGKNLTNACSSRNSFISRSKQGISKSFAVISTKNVVRTFRHLDLKDKNLALNYAGLFGTIPGPILGKYRPSRDRNLSNLIG